MTDLSFICLPGASNITFAKILSNMPGKYRDYGPPREVPKMEGAPLDDRAACQWLVQNARQSGMWIYDPASKQWHTPEEFAEKYDRARSGFAEFFAQCQVRDPNEGVAAGMTKVGQLQEKVVEFMNKVVMYYKKR